jgi:hypothetical protein
MKKSLLIIIAACISTFSNAQVNVEWNAPFSSSFHMVDYGREIQTDAFGNVYVGGHTRTDQQGTGRVLIIKYDMHGNLLWENHGDSLRDQMEDMTIDKDGNVFYTGARWHDSSAEWNYLTVKLDSSGNELWSSEYDGNGMGNGWDYAWGICTDTFHNIFVTGHSQGSFNGYDFVTVKYDASGQEQWVARYDSMNAGMTSNYESDVYETEAGKSGNLYISGYMFDSLTHQLTLIKYDSSGMLIWKRDFDTKYKWPTTNINRNYMKLDLEENIYLLGRIQDSLQSSNLLVVKYDSTGNLLWQREWNSPSNDSDLVSGGFYEDKALQIDKSGNVFISGSISDRAVQFMEDIVTVKYDSLGNFQWQDIYDGTGHDLDLPYGLALDTAGNAYICGETSVSHNIGASDYITYKLNGQTGVHEWNRTFNGTGNLYDQAHAICTDNLNNVYVTGWSQTNNDPFDLHASVVTIKYSQTSTGITENYFGDNVSIYPNPANDRINIQADETIHDFSVDVLNLIGETIYKSKNEKQIDVSDLSDGIYFLKIRYLNNSCIRKIIKN